jgi:hypothetical protein
MALNGDSECCVSIVNVKDGSNRDLSLRRAAASWTLCGRTYTDEDDGVEQSCRSARRRHAGDCLGPRRPWTAFAAHATALALVSFWRSTSWK